MSKSILVTKTPKSCSKCFVKHLAYVSHENIWICSKGKYILNVTSNRFDIHPQCPLQDTTELLDILDSLENTMNYENVTRKYWVEHLNKLHKALGGKKQ